ncbi:FtsX-like permease family protein [Bacillus sp. B-jedd]|uniref:FtsX-like permease family protein n=1 Tax=Bacillus sp. B-jedd TaxID=1476857 RepID=UPI00051568BE|nr:FtsX-like permease family protein [Bacillus sp. B-jedd]CEG28657.1 ABC transporter permease [Bacillus sp. B-jedd]
MTFNQVIWKMAKVQYKKYMFYYLCNSFAVMFFFMFSTVYFNNQIEKAKQLDGIQDALSIPGGALIIFTIFFISLAHNVFMKRRRSEFGLFMTLGMSRSDITRLLVLENGVIAAASIVTGLLAGAIFSRLFFMLLMNSVGMREIVFHLRGKMFLCSVGAFLIVFLLAVGKSLFLSYQSSVLASMKSNRVSQAIKLKSPLLGFFGLALMMGSLLALYVTYVDSDGGLLPLWTLGILAGLYIAFSQFTSFLIEVTKKIPGFYFRRMLFFTSLDYKFKQLTSIIMLVSVMTMITILYSSLLLTFYKSSEKDAIRNNPYDVAFYQTETKNNLPEEKLYAVFEDQDQHIEEHIVIPVLTYYQKHPYVEGVETYQIMGLKEFNRVTSATAKLNDKEYFVYLNSEAEYGEVDVNQLLELAIDNKKIAYEFKGKFVQKAINILPNTHEFIVVNENEFDFLTDSLNAYKSNLHLINVTDWKGTADAVNDLEEKFADLNQSTAPIEDRRIEFLSEKEQFQVAAKVSAYNNIRGSSGIMFFVTTFLTIMFFFGTFILLYLNLFSEIDEEKAKYRKLYKIGITLNEVKKYISSELITVFFAPTLIGTVLAAFYVVILSTDTGGIMHNLDLLSHFFLISSIYLAIQIIYYFYLRNKMMRYLI